MAVARHPGHPGLLIAELHTEGPHQESAAMFVAAGGCDRCGQTIRRDDDDDLCLGCRQNLQETLQRDLTV